VDETQNAPARLQQPQFGKDIHGHDGIPEEPVPEKDPCGSVDHPVSVAYDFEPQFVDPGIAGEEPMRAEVHDTTEQTEGPCHTSDRSRLFQYASLISIGLGKNVTGSHSCRTRADDPHPFSIGGAGLPS
jgi:hypothetical protein